MDTMLDDDVNGMLDLDVLNSFVNEFEQKRNAENELFLDYLYIESKITVKKTFIDIFHFSFLRNLKLKVEQTTHI